MVDPLAIAGHCEVVADIARQYPIPIICALLGAPRSDWQLLSDWTDDIFKVFSWNLANDAPAILCAWEQLDTYLDDMVTRRRRTLTDDLISDLIRAEDDGDRLTHNELLTLAAVLLTAGTDTTRNQLAAAVQTLCDHPDQWPLLAKNPELAPKAVEETMRHSPVVFGTMRAAIANVELGGVLIPARHPGHRQHRRSQPRSRHLRRPRPPRHHPRRPASDADLRRRRALLPRRPPRPTGTRRSIGRHHPPNAARSPHRPRPWKPLTGMSGPTTLPIEFDAGY